MPYFETGRTVSTTDQDIEGVEFFNVHNKIADRPGQAWQPHCGLEQANLFSSMSFTTTQPIVPVFNNASQVGVELTIRVTVAPGGGQTLAVFIDHFDFVTGTYFEAESIGTISGTGDFPLQTARPVPQGWRARLVPSGAGTWTASGSQNSIGALLQKIADGDLVTLGAKADVAATSDTGVFSEVALLKRLLQKFVSQTDAETPAYLALTTTAEQTVIPAPGVGIAIHVIAFTGSNDDASKTRIDFKEGTSGPVRYTYSLAPRGGGFAHASFLWKLPANTPLRVQQSVAVNSFVSINYRLGT